MALPAVDSFSGGAGSLADPPWFSATPDTLVLDGSGGCDVSGAGVECEATWDADSFPDDQYVEAVVKLIGSPTSGDVFVLRVRDSGTDLTTTSDYLGFVAGNGDCGITRRLSGTEVALTTTTTAPLADGDVVRLSAIGTDITLLVNGTIIVLTTDSNVSSGSVGIGLACGAGAGVMQWASFTADEATAPPDPGTHVVTGRGSVTVDSPAWLSTSITGRPDRLSSGEAEPENWYHVGMLSWGTANGAMAAYPVTRDLDLVALPAGMDTLWYEFASGVTATIVELAAP